MEAAQLRYNEDMEIVSESPRQEYVQLSIYDIISEDEQKN
jgi:hypothetical protein